MLIRPLVPASGGNYENQILMQIGFEQMERPGMLKRLIARVQNTAS